MNKKLDYLVFIGRMEPPHVGHLEVILRGLILAEHVIVLIGSSNQPRKFKNPWKFEERKTMLQDSINHLDVDGKYRNRVSILPIRDKKYNDDLWAEGVQKAVQSVVDMNWESEDKPEIGIIGSMNMLISICISLIFLVSGLFYFRSMERTFADTI